MSDESILEIKKVSKRFGGLKALKTVDFDLKKGEVHALIGENGAGKSTLMKIFGGVHSRDEGSIRFRGNEVRFHSPNQSMEAGIAIIYQELSTLPSLTVIENLFMGRMPTRRGIINWKKLLHDSRAALAQVGLERVDPRTAMEKLSIAQRQLVEIAKALTKDAAVVVMDEPNSSLSQAESERLFSVIEDLKAKGIAVIYVSHKLDEVIRVSDRISVLRDGEYVGTIDKKDATEDKLIQMMVGRALNRDHLPRTPGTETVMEVRNISGKGFRNVSFDVRKGEILCFSGLMGAGRSEVWRAIIGAQPWRGDGVFMNGRQVRFRSPKAALRSGLAMLQEDRKRLSLFMGLPISFNMQIGALPGFARKGVINFRAAEKMTRHYVDALDIKLASVTHPVKSLSGGNQQKTILARWLAVNPDILVLDEPTHGVDVGAKAEIYNLIRKLADGGMSVVLISSELPEVLAMADRVAVMHEGVVEAVLNRSEGLSEEKIMRYAAGTAGRGEGVA